MKAFLRFLKILSVSSLVAAVGAWSSLYYLGFRLGELSAMKALQWEPLIVIASIWFLANLVVVYLLSRSTVETKVVTPMLSEAAIADMHSESERKTRPVKSSQSKTLNQSTHSGSSRKHQGAGKPGKSKGSSKAGGSAHSKPGKKASKSEQQKDQHGKKDKANKSAKTKTSKQNGSESATGIIKWFNGQKGYGFITSEEGEEVFVHCRSIKLGGKRQLHTGQQVSFTLLREDKGLKAEEVVILE